MSKNLLTIEQLSEYIGVKPSTIYQWTHYKKIPYIKLGSFVRFDPDDQIDSWVAGNTLLPPECIQ